MSAHTPGPWGHGVNPRHILAGDDEVARAIALGTHRLEEAKANAALIAAAPDLLAACEKALAAFDVPCGRLDIGQSMAQTYALDDLRAAIAKAKGE